ncbi:MAG: glycosyltransferase family 39 protein [Candidatus Kapaibacterium sp.]
MTISTKQHNAIALIIFCALLVFFRLNSSPLTEAESLITFKADLLVQFNGWLDLAPYSAPNGSFILPPMSVWLTAALMKYVGTLPLHLRLVSALLSAVSLIAVYQIARRMMSHTAALLAPALVASTLIWNDHARHVGASMPAVLCTLAALWSLLMLREKDDIPGMVGALVMYGLSISGAFLSSFPAGLLSVLIGVPFLIAIPHRRRWITGGMLLGLVAPVLWYSHMYFTLTSLGSPFSLAAVGSTLAAVLLAQPFIIPAFVAPMVIRWTAPSPSAAQRSYLPEMAIVTWCISLIIIAGFTAFSVEVLLTPALILLALRSFELLASPHKARLAWMVVMGVVGGVVCSFQSSAPGFVSGFFSGKENGMTVLIVGGMALLVVAFGMIIPKVRLYLITSRLLRWLGVILPIILVLRVLVMNISRPAGNPVHEETLKMPLEDAGGQRLVTTLPVRRGLGEY